MSGTLIALLTACAETPGMPPYLPFDDALTDGNEHLPEQSECTPTDLAEIGKEPGLASSTPDVDETAISRTFLEAIPISGCTGSRPLPCYGAICGFRSKWCGRRPLLGREFFRTRVTPYGASTFEDSVIFVHDVERSLEELNEFHKKWIGKIVLQQFCLRTAKASRGGGSGYRSYERVFRGPR
jgi:hypothetical protein